MIFSYVVHAKATMLAISQAVLLFSTYFQVDCRINFISRFKLSCDIKQAIISTKNNPQSCVSYFPSLLKGTHISCVFQVSRWQDNDLNWFGLKLDKRWWMTETEIHRSTSNSQFKMTANPFNLNILSQSLGILVGLCAHTSYPWSLHIIS